MKKITIAILFLGLAKIACAQYKSVEQASNLKFNIKNLGFMVEGSMGGFEGDINFDPKNTDADNFNVTVNPATINTDNSLRDEHLKGDNFFDVKNYPRIRLVSNKITVIKNGLYQFSGTLTIKRRSKALSFPFTVSNSADGYVFKGSFKINRKDFEVGGTSTVADELEVLLSVTARNNQQVSGT